MNYADLKKTDIANGPGVRVSLFVSGCTHGCPGCFNPETWDFQFGQPFTQKTMDTLLAALAPEHIRGLSLLGGEPLHSDNQKTVLEVERRATPVISMKIWSRARSGTRRRSGPCWRASTCWWTVPLWRPGKI